MYQDLYLSLAVAVCRDERRYSEARAQLHRVGAKKAKRLTRQLDHLYDRLILGPASMHRFERTSGPVSAHWRRGHFRMQSCDLASLCANCFYRSNFGRGSFGCAGLSDGGIEAKNRN